MFEKFKLMRMSYNKARKELQEEIERQRQMDELVKSPLKYDLIRDLINKAQADTVMTVNLPDGTKLVFEKKDLYNNIRKNYDGSF